MPGETEPVVAATTGPSACSGHRRAQRLSAHEACDVQDHVTLARGEAVNGHFPAAQPHDKRVGDGLARQEVDCAGDRLGAARRIDHQVAARSGIGDSQVADTAHRIPRNLLTGYLDGARDTTLERPTGFASVINALWGGKQSCSTSQEASIQRTDLLPTRWNPAERVGSRRYADIHIAVVVAYHRPHLIKIVV